MYSICYIIKILNKFFFLIPFPILQKKIYDYHDGKDFFLGGGEKSKTELFTLTRNNSDIFMDYFAKKEWETIDFTYFSRTLHPANEHYILALRIFFDNCNNYIEIFSRAPLPATIFINNSIEADLHSSSIFSNT